MRPIDRRSSLDQCCEHPNQHDIHADGMLERSSKAHIKVSMYGTSVLDDLLGRR